MIGRHIGEKPAHQWSEAAREDCYETGTFSQAHGAEPEGHNADKWQRGLYDGELGHLKAFVRDSFEVIIESADDDGEQNKSEPDVIEHWREAIRADVNVK